MIPILEINGLIFGVPRLWPMGIGAGRPARMELVVGTPMQVELAWADGDRLIETRLAIGGALFQRQVYTWAGDRLERMRHADASGGEDPLGDAYAYDEVWTYDAAGRPLAMRTRWAWDAPDEPHQEWRWSGDGRRVDVVLASQHGVLETRTLALDDHGRTIRIEVAASETAAAREVTLAWSGDRLVSAREQTGADVRAIDFRWSDDGRLVAQTSNGADVWRYTY